MLEDEYFKGFRDFLEKALALPGEYETLSIAPASGRITSYEPRNEVTADQQMTLTFDEAVSRYFNELQHAKPLAAKTMGDKRDALELLKALTDNKSPKHMTKADAQRVKSALLRLPKNRRKNPKTRNLDLLQMLELEDVPCIAARTV